MSKNYVLNDLDFDNVPLKIIPPPESEECDEKELQKSREKNRELIERMRNDKNIGSWFRPKLSVEAICLYARWKGSQS